MRHFVYFSGEAKTPGDFNINELIKAGRKESGKLFSILNCILI